MSGQPFRLLPVWAAVAIAHLEVLTSSIGRAKL
jgi:hypothetical protein